MGDNMSFSNDILLVLLLSILTTQPDDDGEVQFANNTTFLLLLLLVLQNARALENAIGCGCGVNRCGNNCLGCNGGLF